MAFATGADQKPVRLLLVDDHQVFADSLGLALDRNDDFEVVAAVGTPWEAREVLNLGIDVALVDIELGEHDGLTLAKDIAAHFPATRVVVLTAYSDPDTLQQALDIGVNGFILKSVPLAEVVSTIRAASLGQVVVPAPLLTAVVERRRDQERKRVEADSLRSHLSGREIEMLELLAAGSSTNEIAAGLFLSVNTVRTHIQNVLTKLDAHSRLEAVSVAIQSGLIDPPTAGDAVIADVTRLLWRRRWLIALPLALVFLLPSVLSLAFTRTYVSKGSLEVEPTAAVSSVVAGGQQVDPDVEPIQEALDLSQQLLVSRTFLLDVGRSVGMADEVESNPDAVVSRLQSSFDVFPVGPTQLELHATAADAVMARDLAQRGLELVMTERRRRAASDAASAQKVFTEDAATQQTLLLARQSDLQAFRGAHPEVALAPDKQNILNMLSVLRTQLGQTRVQLEQGTGDATALLAREADLLVEISNLAIPVGATPDVELELLRLEAAHQEARTSLDDAVRRASEARLLSSVAMQRVAGDRVVDTPFVPSTPSRGKALTASALALVVAVALAAGLVALAEHLDPTIRRIDDVTASSGLPVLAVVARP